MTANEQNSGIQRLSLILRGAVQGVGFRPYVYHLAAELHLPGWVSNSSQGVQLEVEGPKEVLEIFLVRLVNEIPPHASLQNVESLFLNPIGYSAFEIRESRSDGEKTALILPDIAVCPKCLSDTFNPSSRRYLYPFTNCTHCGPRFSIIESLPYDRPNTSMKNFPMCADCKTEYENPEDRRFHAQPNACPHCGPQIQVWDNNGNMIAERHDALLHSAESIRSGKIVAVKGLGGFHLITDARNREAAALLRQRKHREEKPFALMVPSLDEIKKECFVNDLEERLLLSPESPIVLLRRTASSRLESAAPENPYFGCMLPATPLHHILMHELGFPVIATSGNLSDEPMCIDEHEAVQRLHGIADEFLIHNRPIVRHVDDSIVRCMMGRELVLRRARGYAPLPIVLETPQPISSIAVGAHLKNTIALSSGRSVFISQHIGDLETKQSFDAFHHIIADFQAMYESTPSHVICDLHPDYLSSKYARRFPGTIVAVQHHYAHIASCMAEHRIHENVLGVSWDGTGYGPDGTIWGGEFLHTTRSSYKRIASFFPFRLPGGEKAVREPRRSAIGILYELFGDDLFDRTDLSILQAFSSMELRLIRQMFLKKTPMPVTSSVGRLFDAVAALIGLQYIDRYEGQAAMKLEFLTMDTRTEDRYSFTIARHGDIQQIDWRPMGMEILADIQNHIAPAILSQKFHNTLPECILAIAAAAGERSIVLSGGCFQNLYLTERTIRRLREEGFIPVWHQRVPPNDGGISLGQIYAAHRLMAGKNT